MRDPRLRLVRLGLLGVAEEAGEQRQIPRDRPGERGTDALHAEQVRVGPQLGVQHLGQLPRTHIDRGLRQLSGLRQPLRVPGPPIQPGGQPLLEQDAGLVGLPCLQGRDRPWTGARRRLGGQIPFKQLGHGRPRLGESTLVASQHPPLGERQDHGVVAVGRRPDLLGLRALAGRLVELTTHEGTHPAPERHIPAVQGLTEGLRDQGEPL